MTSRFKLTRFYGHQPRLSTWTIGPALFDWIRQHLPDGSTILELGSGDGTHLLAQHYTLFSVEHDPRYLGQYDSHYLYAPLVEGWYDVDALQDGLPAAYDLLLIDGPPGAEARLGVLPHLDLFQLERVAVDDCQRPGGMRIVQAIFDRVGGTARYVRYVNEPDGRIAAWIGPDGEG